MPPVAAEADFLCLKSIHSDAYIHYVAIVDSFESCAIFRIFFYLFSGPALSTYSGIRFVFFIECT